MSRGYEPGSLGRGRRGVGDRDLLERLRRGLVARDADAIGELLHPEAAVVIDSGGHLPTVDIPVTGRSAVVAELVALMVPETGAASASINGVPGLTILRDRQIVGTLTAEVRSGRLAVVWVVCNPDKLRPWNQFSPAR
ncbi:hypothetical protein [Microbacterium gorillae]|uniref:hypothetical protein n=1 Tax=Microbacterium gorillae TaxID=1231063 RepID=UPI003D9908D2